MNIYQFRNTRRKMDVADFCEMADIDERYFETESYDGTVLAYLDKGLWIDGPDKMGNYSLMLDRSGYIDSDLGRLEELLYNFCKKEGYL